MIVFLRDVLRKLRVLLLHLQQLLISPLGLLKSAPHLILQGGVCPFQLLLQMRHLSKDKQFSGIEYIFKPMNKKGSLFGSKNQNIKHRETQPYSPHDALLAEWSSLCSI